MELERIAPRRRPTAEQRLQMVELFRHSGLTRAGFSRQYGIPLATLNWWLAKARRASILPAPIVFNEVRLTPPAVAPPHPWVMEVVAPSGLTIRCREALSAREVARLIRDTRC